MRDAAYCYCCSCTTARHYNCFCLLLLLGSAAVLPCKLLYLLPLSWLWYVCAVCVQSVCVQRGVCECGACVRERQGWLTAKWGWP